VPARQERRHATECNGGRHGGHSSLEENEVKPLLIAIILSPAVTPWLPAQDATARLVGCWMSDTEPVVIERFGTDDAWAMREGGHTTYGQAKITEKTITVRVRGQCVEESYSLDGIRLAIVLRGKTTSYHPCVKPADFDPQPVALGKPEAVAPKMLAGIKAELARRLETDQGVRTGTLKDRSMQAVDSDNTAYLVALVREMGWIDCARFGTEAANTAFLIVQHSGDLPLMMAALPPIEKDAKAKLIDAQGYALLYDRLELDLGRKQRYGSQIGMDEQGRMVVLPIEDRTHVEEFRSEMGLQPLSAYLDAVRKMYGGKEIRYGDD
jgi:hypothetical protein